ncbi:MAG: ABC transporter permease subunit [Alphaproteobacteria bacterium]|nr:ABC transporter permease subunit [Alphaproteobacteria bacterium]
MRQWANWFQTLLAYILKRLLLFIPTLAIIFLVNFAVLEWLPGSPANYVQSVLDESCLDEGLPEVTGQIVVPEELLKELETYYGLNQPRISRFMTMLKKYFFFDLGKSYRTGESVREVIFASLPVTLFVGLFSFLFLYMLAAPIGLLQAYWRGGGWDYLSNAVLLTLYATPVILVAMALLLCFSTGYIVNYFPSSGLTSLGKSLTWWGQIKDYVWHLCLPVCTIVLSALARPVYLMRQAAIAEMEKTYVYSAMTRGLSKSYIFIHHILRNSFIPILGYMPSQLSNMMLERPFFVEIIFSFGGIGSLTLQAFEARDYTMIFGILYVFSLIRVGIQLLGDLIAVAVDPRVHFGKVRR